MAGVDISSVVEKLEGDLVRTRDEGIEDLKYLLASSRNGNKLKGLGDDGFHRILESLYRIIRSDKAAFLKSAARSKTRPSSTSRLSGSATALRLTVEAGVSKIRFKTAISVIDHIVGVLPTADEGFFEPLRNDYLKCFRILLEYQTYGEHLKTKQWQEFIDFTVGGISACLGDDEQDGSHTSGRDTSMSSRSGSHRSLLVSQSSGQRTSRYSAKSSLDDLLGALRALVQISNAPVMTKAPSILNSVLDCLVSVTRAQDVALEIFNILALTLKTENVVLLVRGVSRLVPIFHRLWSTKSIALRDQILATLSIIRPLFLASHHGIGYLDPFLREKVLEILENDYIERGSREMLQLGDIVVQLSSFHTNRPGHVLVPVRDSPHVLTTWSLLCTTASLVCSLTSTSYLTNASSDDDGQPSKRRKLITRTHEVLNRAIHSDGLEKLVAIQILYFLYDQCLPLPEDVEQRLPELESSLLSDDPQIVGWAMLLFSRFSWSNLALESKFHDFWLKVQDHIRRALATSSTSRAACLLIDTMLRRRLFATPINAAGIQYLLFSGGKNGPAAFSDAALLMFTTILQSDYMDRDEAFEAFSMKLVGWLELYWNLPSVLDRSHNAHMAFHGQPELLCSLVAAMRGSLLQFEVYYRCSEPHALVRTDALFREHNEFSTYLTGISAATTTDSRPTLTVQERHLNKEVAARLNHAVFEMLRTKSKASLLAWTNYANERSSNIGDDIITIVASICITIKASLATAAIEPSSHAAIAKAENDGWQKIIELIAQEQGDTKDSRAVLLSFIVLRLRDPLGGTPVLSKQFLSMSKTLLDIIRRAMETANDEASLDVDMMDSMETRTSQGIQSASALGTIESNRRELIQIAMVNTSLVSCVLELAIQSARGVSNGVPDSDSMSRLVDDMVTLDAGPLLTARQSMYELLRSGTSLARSDASRLLKHLAESCLQNEDYERSEAAICCCAKIMTKLSHLWTSDIDDDLTDCAFDVYGWLIDIALAKSMASPQALFNISQMLDVVSGLSPSYGSNDDLPSPRTSLLKILLNAPAGLKYRLSAFLTRMFDRYILSEHGAIFNDIVEALPSDPGNLEGIGVRFHILAELGSSWHTILRQSTYHLFETAIHVPGLMELGKLCVQRMSTTLKLPSAKYLFRSFSPQIFYTWLGVGEIQQVPFEEFGYETLADLVSENESELVAQTALRGSKQHAQVLSRLLNTTWNQLLDKHFAHAEAYCLASQMSLPDREQLYIGSEALIRKDLSTETYTTNLRDKLPSVIARLFITLQDDHGMERAFEKSSLSQPLSILRRICGYSSSPMTLPVGQQPCFRAKFIVEEIEWLCKRTDFKFDVIWAPALLTHVYRALLQSVNPTLGPLHAASVLRKIRAVVCLGGASAVRGYSLEMLLHALRPFLTVFQCSEDALGIYWYLLEAGKEHLQRHLSFLAGLGVSIFASLTAFISSSQESTTQESHFLSTMSKATEFQKWLGEYLLSLEPEGEDDDRVDNFRELIGHAKSMTAGGSSSRSSPEGNVLLCLLRDRTTKDPLLNEMHFYLSLGILCKSFCPAPEPSDDIIADQENLASYTPVLQTTLHRLSLSNTFRTWTAYVIGKACSAVGPEALQTHEATDQKLFHRLSNTLSTSASYSAILNCLESLIWQGDLETAAAAEQCLQEIATVLEPSTAVAMLGKEHDQRLLDDLRFADFPCPTPIGPIQASNSRSTLELWQAPEDTSAWAPLLVLSLCDHLMDDPILGTLRQFALSAPAAAGEMLPYAVHLVLAAELNRAQLAKTKVSTVFALALKERKKEHQKVIKIILETLLYLRRCPLPVEGTVANRNHWLEIDFGDAADAAAACEMWHAALLFIEIQQSQIHLLASRSTRRSTLAATSTIPDVTAMIFQKVDDPDFFYAGHEDVDLSSVIQRLEHESSGLKTLSFRSAAFDAAIRTQEDRATFSQAAFSAARALSTANLKGISQAVTALADGQSQTLADRDASDMFFDFYNWNIDSENGALEGKPSPLKALRTLSSASSTAILVQALDVGLLQSIDEFPKRTAHKEIRARSLCALATLAEARDSLSLSGPENFDAFLQASAAIEEWSQRENIEQISPLLSGREYLFGTIRRNEELRTALSLSQPQALLIEARVIRQSLQVAQHHSASQFSLSRATYLSRLTEKAAKMGLHLEAASQFALARTFWSQGEISASVKIMQHLKHREDLKTQDILVPTSEILAELGTKAAEARLEPPDEIIANYLIPAYKELGGNTQGSEAGKVFHNFAAFCDAQLQDPDSRDDYTRVEKIRETKLLEMEDLERLIKSREGRNKEVLKGAYNKAKTWFRLDDEEFQRLQGNREALILRCLENYLLSMKACDDFPNDSLRVLSIWLDQSHNERVNNTVHKYLQHVPSIKFAALVNQLTSRLMDSEDAFAQILMDLMFRICSDHPYHGMYQLFAASKSKGAKSDELANSRHLAAGKLGDLLRAKSPSGKLWISLHNASIAFVRVAQERLSEKDLKTGAKFFLRDSNHGAHLIRTVEGADRRIPPPTMKIALRPNRDYSTVPVMKEFEPQVSIAGGISAPKITTVLASDGSRNKMLLKGGNDDLRQDSIMEQVFEQVSNLLKDHRTTRQRKLGIRTYKVVPLVSNAGIIEFVQHTIPLHDYLLPAHKRYFPKNYRHTKCREEIAKAQTSPLKQRIQAYRNATANFHPVMRFFFTEHFLDPDEWFYKRLNYSRSTAAISILGHVLGLGDRHGHNILLDTNTGEVVHIDLGVAFEAGRILPVPEVVPFRLTRDLVDGMGISGVKGVFQRCCNFTLEALRWDQESIMTILDVLRYDPLYSWSLSPVRLQKMQENAEQAAAAAAAGKHTETNATGITDNGAAAAAGMGLGGAGIGARKDINEPSEADRALTVVAKKLGKTLSVEATVNELIRQATDERNLAVLYCGWAAYA